MDARRTDTPSGVLFSKKRVAHHVLIGRNARRGYYMILSAMVKAISARKKMSTYVRDVAGIYVDRRIGSLPCHPAEYLKEMCKQYE